MYFVRTWPGCWMLCVRRQICPICYRLLFQCLKPVGSNFALQHALEIFGLGTVSNLWVGALPSTLPMHWASWWQPRPWLPQSSNEINLILQWFSNRGPNPSEPISAGFHSMDTMVHLKILYACMLAGPHIPNSEFRMHIYLACTFQPRIARPYRAQQEFNASSWRIESVSLFLDRILSGKLRVAYVLASQSTFSLARWREKGKAKMNIGAQCIVCGFILYWLVQQLLNILLARPWYLRLHIHTYIYNHIYIYTHTYTYRTMYYIYIHT